MYCPHIILKIVPGYARTIILLDEPSNESASTPNDFLKSFIFVKTILDNGGGILSGNNNTSVSSMLSHEAIEMLGDRYSNTWIDGPSINEGNQYAIELCDPVEGDTYLVKINEIDILVSNFIFPSWFNPKATASLNMPFDYLKKLNAPFTISVGGNMTVRNAGHISQVCHKHYPNWKKFLKHKRHFRLGKIFIYI